MLLFLRLCGELFITGTTKDIKTMRFEGYVWRVFMKCNECMKDAPYDFCCKVECGEHEFCRGCEVSSRGGECPNDKDRDKVDVL